MLSLRKTGRAEKDRYCQNIYEKYILETAEFLQSCNEIAEILRTYIPSGCYTNFRDMLFHFRCLVNTNEENEMLSQSASIVEHANRAVRDAEVALCMRCITVFEVLTIRHPLNKDAVDVVGRQIELLQNWVIKLRLGSMMLEGMEILSPSNEDFLDMMEAYFECAKVYATKEFKEVIAYSRKLKEDFRTILKNIFESKGNSELQNFKAFTTYNDLAELVYEAAFED